MAVPKAAGAVHKIMREMVKLHPRTTTAQIISQASVESKARSLVQPDLNKSLDDLRAFHNDHLLRIRELHLSGTDPITISSQLADVRLSLSKISFEISLRGESADLALLIGGSTVKGNHTFLTDLDLLVIPGRYEDIPAAKRVEQLMLENLARIGLDADPIMLGQFETHPLTSSAINRYALRPKEKYEGFLDTQDGKVWMAWGVYFKYLTDIKIIAISQTESQVAEHLKDVQDFIFSKPDCMLEICYSHFENLLKNTQSDSIKKFALRPLFEALYAFRTIWDMRSSSIWLTIESTYNLGYLTKEQKRDLTESLSFFLRLRHDIGTSFEEALDTSLLDPALRAELAEKRDLGLGEFNDLIEIHGQTLRDISGSIFKMLKEGVNSKGDESNA